MTRASAAFRSMSFAIMHFGSRNITTVASWMGATITIITIRRSVSCSVRCRRAIGSSTARMEISTSSAVFGIGRKRPDATRSWPLRSASPLPDLPPNYTTVTIRGVPYYYANNTYYLQSPSGYLVVDPPAPDGVAELPPTTSTAQPAEPNSVIELPRN